MLNWLMIVSCISLVFLGISIVCFPGLPCLMHWNYKWHKKIKQTNTKINLLWTCNNGFVVQCSPNWLLPCSFSLEIIFYFSLTSVFIFWTCQASKSLYVTLCYAVLVFEGRFCGKTLFSHSSVCDQENISIFTFRSPYSFTGWQPLSCWSCRRMWPTKTEH